MSNQSENTGKSRLPEPRSNNRLSSAQIRERVGELQGDWTLESDETCLVLHLKFKGYAKAVYHANLVAWMADQQGHHPDVTFGWGYCTVRFTTHDAAGLTALDFVCAAKLDQMLADS